ncbi:MAG: ABC transporter substrate-binding protein, partial [Acidimicrobiales bacterium]
VGISSPPTTWQGFLSMCQTLKSKGYIPIAWPGATAGDNAQLLNSMVMNNAPVPDMFAQIQAGKLKATDPWFVKTLSQYAELRPYFQPDAVGSAVGPADELFASGKAAMLARGDYAIAPVRQLGATFKIGLLSPITVNTSPKYTGVYNLTYIMGVKSNTPNRDTALAFVDYLSQPGPASVFANGEDDHVTVKGATYTEADLAATSVWLHRPTILAPNYQWTDLQMETAMAQATISVVGGTSPQQAAATAQNVIDQQRAQSES